MDAKKKKALIEELTGKKKKKFTENYSEPNRRWFVDKLVRLYEAQGASEAQIIQNVREVVNKSKAVVRAKRDQLIGLKETKAQLKFAKPRREEILYGAIAHHPEFVAAANSDLLDFIFKRRYRGVFRMNFFVNPNGSRGYFRYPERCKTDQSWRVNVDAQAFWERADPGKYVPLTLKAPASGAIDPVRSINTLFIPKKDPCQGNLFECAAVLTIILMDTLQEAKDPGKLLNQIANRQPNFLVIYHPNNTDPPHFIVDTSLQSLFTKLHQPVGDIQVGDHIYIHNHPLYKVFVPEGSWTGEHSLLYNCGNRSIRGKNGFVFGGHGKEGTVFQFYNDFLKELQTYLHRSYSIGKIFLTYKISNDTSIPASKVSTHDDVINLPGGGTTPVRLYQFDVDFSYTNYEKTPSPSNPKANVREHGLVIAHLPDKREFGILRQKTIAEVLLVNNFDGSIPFHRKDPPPNPFALFDPAAWSIYYTDPDTAVAKDYFPFSFHKNKLVFRRLTIDELFENPFGKLDPFATGAAMTLPKVDFSSSYRTFLTTNGAL